MLHTFCKLFSPKLRNTLNTMQLIFFCSFVSFLNFRQREDRLTALKNVKFLLFAPFEICFETKSSFLFFFQYLCCSGYMYSHLYILKIAAIRQNQICNFRRFISLGPVKAFKKTLEKKLKKLVDQKQSAPFLILRSNRGGYFLYREIFTPGTLSSSFQSLFPLAARLSGCQLELKNVGQSKIFWLLLPIWQFEPKTLCSGSFTSKITT